MVILGVNGTGKSTPLHLIRPPTLRRHRPQACNPESRKVLTTLGNQLPYDLCPIEHFQQFFSQKFPEKDIVVRLSYWSYIGCDHWLIERIWIGLKSAVGSIWLSGAHQTAPFRQLSDGLRNRWVFLSLPFYFGASVLCCPLFRSIYLAFVLLLSMPSSYTHFCVLSCELRFLLIILELLVCSSTLSILRHRSLQVSLVSFPFRLPFPSFETRGPMRSYLSLLSRDIY